MVYEKPSIREFGALSHMTRGSDGTKNDNTTPAQTDAPGFGNGLGG